MKVLLHVNYYEGAGKFETLFKLIRAVGADGVELRGGNHYDMGKEKYLAMVEELKQRNPDLELTFGYQLHFSSIDDDAQKREFDDFVDFIDWASSKCGTRLLNMFTDDLLDPNYSYLDFDHNGSALADDLLYARHGAGLTQVGRELEARNMLGALESHNCYIHDTAKSCAKLLLCVKSPAIGINYDHGNIALNSQGETIDEVFELLKGKIYYAHLKNMLFSHDLKYFYPTHLADGHIDTCQVMSKLKDELKSGIFAIEYACSGDGVIAAHKDMEYVRFLRSYLGC